MPASDRNERRNLANSRLAIDAAVRMVGGDAWSATGKQWCPFGALNHIDGGQERAFRLYPDDNTAFCFAGCGFFTPVKMIALGKDLNEDDAIEYILEQTGYRPPTTEKRWEAATTITTHVDTDALAEALRVYCTRLAPDFDVRRFEDPISTVFRKCLALTSRVHTPDEARQWLDTTKQIMRRVLL